MDFNSTSDPVLNRLSVLKVEVRSGCIYIKLLWQENQSELFKIQIFDSDNNTWAGSFSHDSVMQCRESFEIEDEQQYKASVKEALTGVGNSYVYDFDVNKGEFRWKKKFPDSVVVEHGRVSVQRDREPTPIYALIDILIEQNHSLLDCIEESSKSRDNILAELEQCKQELDNFIDTKVSLEETVYGKFLQLLNEKKKRISLLDEALKAMD